MSKGGIHHHHRHTVCVKDCGHPNQSIDVIILFACLVGWLDSSPLDSKKLRHDL